MLLLCNYYVTYNCNAKCGFCSFKDNSEPLYASLEDFRSNVSQLAQLGVKFIDLTGGEPLLNKNIVSMAEYARSLKMQTSITTNTLLYRKFAVRLAGKINLLHFSLDSPDEEEHNSIRGVKCYRSVFESIDIAKGLGEFPDILFTVTDDTYKKLPGMYELSQKHGLVLIVNPVFSYFGNPGLSQQAIEYIEDFVKGRSGIYINPSFLKLRKDGGNNILDPKCKAVSRVIVISPGNEIVLPCYHFSRKTLPIDAPIKELREGSLIKKFMEMEGRFDFCQGCTVNCYFEPSFAFPTNIYGLLSVASKFRYGYHKLVKQKLQRFLGS